MRIYWSSLVALLDLAPWHCWRQGHRWRTCLKDPKDHTYPTDYSEAYPR